MRVACGLAALLLAVSAAPVASQDKPAGNPGAVKIGLVNVQALLRGMPGFAQAESTYNKEFEAGQTEAQKLQAVFDSSVAQYQQSQAMMTPSNRTARERQLQAQRDTVVAKVQAIEARVAAKQRELLGPIQDRLRAVIDGVRAEGNYALIIDVTSEIAAGIIAYDKALDITLKVAARLAGSES